MTDGSLYRRALPKVTIMIPTYRQGAMVLEAVESALAQDYPNLEIVVSDDASPDDTTAIVSKCVDPRLRYYRNASNLGRAANYRRALYELATGEWVVNLDGDDYYTDPKFIAAAVATATSDCTIVMVAAGCTTITKTRQDIRMPAAAVIDGRDLLKDPRQVPYYFKHMATLYNRAKAMEIGFYRREVISTDWESLFRLALRGKVAFLPRSIGVWRLHGNNASSNSDWRSLADNLQIWPTVYTEAIAHGMDPTVARQAMRSVLVFFSYLAVSNIVVKRGVADVCRFLTELWRLDRSAACCTLLRFKIMAKLLLATIGGPWGRAL